MTQERRRKAGTEPEKSSSSQVLALSLFIMLLAFFIVLNTMTTYEESKVKPIMESLESAFASKLTQQGDLKPSVTESDEMSIHEGSAMDRVEALFTTQIPGSNIKRQDFMGTMHIRLPWDQFKSEVLSLGQDKEKADQNGGVSERPAESQLMPEAVPEESAEKKAPSILFLPTLVSLIRSDQLGTPLRLDITLNLDDNPPRMHNHSPQIMIHKIDEISAIGQKLEQAGLPAKLVTIGFQKGKVDMVDLFFRHHEAYNPLGTTLEGKAGSSEVQGEETLPQASPMRRFEHDVDLLGREDPNNNESGNDTKLDNEDNVIMKEGDPVQGIEKQ